MGGGILLKKLINNEKIGHITVFSKNPKKHRDKYNSHKLAWTDNFSSIEKDADINACFIALPAPLHYDFAKKSLMSGKNVFVEKPMTLSYEEACEISLLADEFGKTLTVDHTFLFTPQIRRVKALLDTGRLGKLKFYDSARLSLGNIQKDVNVIWDLAVHDIAILEYLFEERPVKVKANGYGSVYNGVVSGAVISLSYQSGFSANIKVSWDYPEKIRDIFIIGSKAGIKYDDTAVYDERLKVIDNYYDFNDDGSVSYTVNGCSYENIPHQDAVETAINEFLDICENGGGNSLSDGVFSSRVIKILEKTDYSLKNNGAEVEI